MTGCSSFFPFRPGSFVKEGQENKESITFYLKQMLHWEVILEFPVNYLKADNAIIELHCTKLPIEEISIGIPIIAILSLHRSLQSTNGIVKKIPINSGFQASSRKKFCFHLAFISSKVKHSRLMERFLRQTGVLAHSSTHFKKTFSLLQVLFCQHWELGKFPYGTKAILSKHQLIFSPDGFPT